MYGSFYCDEKNSKIFLVTASKYISGGLEGKTYPTPMKCTQRRKTVIYRRRTSSGTDMGWLR